MVNTVLFGENFKNLSSDAKILYLFISNYIVKNKKEFIELSISEIEILLNCKRFRSENAKNELLNNGLIRQKRQGLSKPNLYYIADNTDDGNRKKLKTLDIKPQHQETNVLKNDEMGRFTNILPICNKLPNEENSVLENKENNSPICNKLTSEENNVLENDMLNEKINSILKSCGLEDVEHSDYKCYDVKGMKNSSLNSKRPKELINNSLDLNNVVVVIIYNNNTNSNNNNNNNTNSNNVNTNFEKNKKNLKNKNYEKRKYNTDKTNDVNNNDSVKSSEVKILQERIKNELGLEIKDYSIRKMLSKKTMPEIVHYINNWDKLKSNKYNPAGFFINAVLNSYVIPEPTELSSMSYRKPVQSTNYEQREYDDEFFENLYDNDFSPNP